MSENHRRVLATAKEHTHAKNTLNAATQELNTYIASPQAQPITDALNYINAAVQIACATLPPLTNHATANIIEQLTIYRLPTQPATDPKTTEEILHAWVNGRRLNDTLDITKNYTTQPSRVTLLLTEAPPAHRTSMEYTLFHALNPTLTEDLPELLRKELKIHQQKHPQDAELLRILAIQAQEYIHDWEQGKRGATLHAPTPAQATNPPERDALKKALTQFRTLQQGVFDALEPIIHTNGAFYKAAKNYLIELHELIPTTITPKGVTHYELEWFNRAQLNDGTERERIANHLATHQPTHEDIVHNMRTTGTFLHNVAHKQRRTLAQQLVDSTTWA